MPDDDLTSDLSKLAFFDLPIWTALAETKQPITVYRDQSRLAGTTENSPGRQSWVWRFYKSRDGAYVI
jgi:hypothetical protein